MSEEFRIDDEVSFIVPGADGSEQDAKIMGVVRDIEDGVVQVMEVHAASVWGNSQNCAGEMHSVNVQDLKKEKLASWARAKVPKLIWANTREAGEARP